MSMSVHNPRRNPPGLVVLVSKEVEIRDCAPASSLENACNADGRHALSNLSL